MNQIDRPRFFEGQHLGAADLGACVDYTRIRSARHELGAHLWGIATGLELVEQPLASGAVQVTISPGCAWDGHGRLLVVLAPVILGADLFRNHVSDTAAEGDVVKIWLTYAEDASRNPQPGFEVCQGDQHARVAETFAVEAGELEVAHKVVVAGRTLGAKAVRKAFDTAAPDLHDESVPYQEVPDTGALPRWPILLGYVRWFKQGGAPGYIKPRSDAGTSPDTDRIRALRRYIGVVAEEVLGADGRLRLRDRNKAPSANYSAPSANTVGDLLWVEGHARIEGDLRLLGGQLEWRQAGGSFADVPLFARRNEANPQGGKSLEIAFAADQPAPEGKNSLVFGVVPKTNGAFGDIDEKMVIRDNGDVGIGTPTPRSRLEVKGRPDLAGTAWFVPDPGKGDHVSCVHWDRTGDWYLRSAASSGRVILQDTGGSVGIGTAAPDHALTVQGSAGTYLNVKADNGAEEVLLGADSGGGIVSTMSNHSLQLRAGANSTKMLIQPDGNVGIGTNSPAQKLHVGGPFLRVEGISGEQAEVGSERSDSVVFGSRKAATTIADFRNLTVPFSTGNASAWLTLYCRTVFEVSDVRAKTGVQPLSGALARLMQLQGVSYEWKDDKEAARRIGLIAQEVQQVVPEAVSTGERGAGISYSSLIPVLIEALKELKAEVDSLQPLKDRYAQLEAEMARLRADGGGKPAGKR